MCIRDRLKWLASLALGAGVLAAYGIHDAQAAYAALPADGTAAVSYTHLDVYKRQGIDSVKAELYLVALGYNLRKYITKMALHGNLGDE